MSNNKLSPLSQLLITEIANAERGMSGYDLTKVMDSVWGAKHQQIYRDLNAMAAQGLLGSTPVPQTGKPDLKIHHVTQAGNRVREELLRREFKEVKPMSFRSDSVSKLALGNWTYFESLIVELEKLIAQAERQLKDRDAEYSTTYGKLVLERNVMHWQAELDYAHKALAFVVADK